MSQRRFDLAVVGAGIVGLAHAWAAAKRGLSVVLLERDLSCQGASIRNFGMVWPIGHTPEVLPIALESRALWLELLRETGIWHRPEGSVFLAFHEDEATVMKEFVASAADEGYQCRWLDRQQVLGTVPAANPDGLLGGMASDTEICVDSPATIARVPRWLAQRYGVELRFGSQVIGVEHPQVILSDGSSYQADRIVIASGHDTRTLFPEVYEGAGIYRCKLQMMAAVPQPDGWRIGPMLAGGLTLRHYASFRRCPSLSQLKQRIARETPQYDRFAIHLMASQHESGQVIMGDSHEYGDETSPFDSQEIDDHMLAGLRKMLQLKDWRIARRWHGIYAKHATMLEFVAEPQPNVRIVHATGGTGMSLSFGTAERMWRNWEAPAPGLPIVSVNPNITAKRSESSSY